MHHPRVEKHECAQCNGNGFIMAYSPAWLRAQREAAGLSLRSLGAIVGLSAPFLCDVEHGKRRCSKWLAQRYGELGDTAKRK